MAFFKNLDQLGRNLRDININSLDKSTPKFKHLGDFCDSFDLINLIKEPTCFQSETPTSIDIMLTNKSRSFMHTKSIVNCLSDWHSIIFTMFKKHISRIAPIEINYRSFTKFNEQSFLSELEQNLNRVDFTDESNDFSDFLNIFKNTAEKHAPMKKKTIRDNNEPL